MSCEPALSSELTGSPEPARSSAPTAASAPANAVALACPVPWTGGDRVLLGHGGGGRLTAELIAQRFLPAFANPHLSALDDCARLAVGGARLAFTTDSYVVTPLFFPGGDIGTLAVHGTINDLATAGARPLYVAAAFILEEGFPLADLDRIVASMRAAAEAAGVLVVTGDTKVVGRGKADGCFVTTTGLGVIEHDRALSADRARPGDVVVLSGPVADHGVAIMATRADLALETPVVSDTAALHRVALDAIATGADLRCLRDPTRGGVATALNEIAQRSRVGIELDEDAISVREPVRGVCELLGLDPLHVANEGKLLAIVAAGDADRVVEAMRCHREGREARAIGTVVAGHAPLVVLRTAIGGARVVDMLAGDPLPRIC